jgi:hypothetical protein
VLPRAGSRFLAAALMALVLATAVAAQDFGLFRRRRGPEPRFPTADSFDGYFNFCRGMYYSDRHEDGGQGWWTDYEAAEVNFSIRLSELTKTRVSRTADGQPNHLVVRLTDDELFKCPFLEMEDVGTARFTDDEVKRLRQYLLKGGFIWVDDFWGEAAWWQWVEEIQRVLPKKEFPIRRLEPDHPIFRTFFQVPKVPQIPSIAFWRRSGGQTSERGAESAVPQMYAISDSHDRIMVLMTHNTDISDAWEREGEDPRFFYQFSPNGYAVGINALMYSMSH